MKLETQLERLVKLGLAIDPDITIEDILSVVERSALERDPFKLLLYAFGAESVRAPLGRRICNRVWNLDPEGIETTGDYANIARQLCLLSGNPDWLTEIVDYIDVEADEWWLEYTIAEQRRHYTVALDRDWVDMLMLSDVMEDIQRDSYLFYLLEHEQVMILLYLDRVTADRLGDLCDEDLEPVVPT
ncbi:hypothetical protein [Chamaesiphon sp. VAR_69_metabat_338]|uniref:hypothetical protein n=1 Tax=Chamaesiphon sp. VAR_69_metabat_338 TaxID=2964704 RepID=UPI00286DE856|nr:hypothetical protein [Chamaesiphon sp. VAR_69_metabat_338]